MASNVYTRGMYLMAKGDLDLDTADVRALLVTNAYTPNVDHDYVSDVVANEYNGSGYVRKALTTLAVSLDDANNWVKFASDNVVWTALGAGAAAASYIILYKYNASDNAAELICCGDFTDTNGNGGDFTVNCPTNGWFTINS